MAASRNCASRRTSSSERAERCWRRLPGGRAAATRHRSLASKGCRTARIANDLCVLASGDPNRIARRMRNRVVERALGSAGMVRMLCG